jgi:nucleotide-binding universal stress UspA family protein
MFRTILVPLDGSPFAEHALPWALSLARRAGAKLDLVRSHVLYALREPAAAWVPYDPVMEDESVQEDQLYLNATSHWLASVSPVAVNTAVVPGLDADGILERARSEGADLIVMVTHGRGPVGRALLGSMADQVVRRSAVPVLLVGPDEAVPGLLPEPAIEGLLVPLDGSALAEQVLGPAANLARLLDVGCTLLRVVEAHDVPAAADEADAREYVDRIAGRLREEGVRVQTQVRVARHAAEAILKEAQTLSGVIALATHGRGGVRRMLVGSVADKVIRRASCPVLVYRPRHGSC